MTRMLICAATLAAISSTGGTCPANAGDEPVWHSDFAKAKTIAKRLKRPLFVVFR